MTIMISRMARTVTMMKMEMLTATTTLVVATVTPSRCNDSAVLHVFSERAYRDLRFPLLCRALACGPARPRPARGRFFSVTVPPCSRLVRFAHGPDLLPWGAFRIGSFHTSGFPDGRTDPSATSRGSPVACLWPTQSSPASGLAQPGVRRDPALRRAAPLWLSGARSGLAGPARPGPAWLGTTTVNTRSTHGQHDGQHTVNTTVNIP